MNDIEPNRIKGDILIVDDTLPNLQTLSSLLAEQGYEVRGARNGSTALLFVESQPPDLILLDIRMPGPDGFEVCRRLKADEKTRNIPVIFISALDEVVDKVKGFEAGGVDYITKPFQIEEVLVRVKTHLTLYKLQNKLEQRVEERTAELARANANLKAEIVERKRAEEERRQLAEQYYQSQKMEAIGLLAGGIAHDFNNLLTAINGFAELMQLRMESNDPLWKMATTILHSGQRAATLTRQLLAFSRKQVIEVQVLDLGHVISDMEKMLGRIIGDHIEMETHLAFPLWPVKIDPSQMEQVIVNLAVNARDAMPDGGRLVIELANVVLDEAYIGNHFEVKPGDYLLLSVSDTGYGMSKEVQAHLFEPFFTTKEMGKGTGLGLATVFGIVKQSEGAIWVYSEEGVGTTFKIYLPRGGEVAASRSPQEATTSLPAGSETILLVEDDANVRELTRHVLAGQGYSLLEAQDGAEALRVFKHHFNSIHMLLTDVIMPGISGRELAGQLVEQAPDLKVLFVSGYTGQVIARQGVLEPGVAFLPKPFSPLNLARKVREVLDG